MTDNCKIKTSIKMSIIVPVYNVGAYLKECLDSLINQDLKEIEIICINDGSTDNSLEILNEYAKNDERVIVITQENQGQGEARNVGIDLAKGEYLFFVDPDDYVEKNSLSKIYSFAKENDSNIVWFDFKVFDEHSGEFEQKTFPKYIFGNKEDAKELETFTMEKLKKNFFQSSTAVWNRIFKTDFIKNNNIKFPKSRVIEDCVFSIIATSICNKTDNISLSVYCYRKRAGSTCYSLGRHGFDVFETVNYLENFLKSNNLYNKYKKEYENYRIVCFVSGFSMLAYNLKDEYINKVKKELSLKDFNIFMKFISEKRSFLENIFSIRSSFFYSLKYKIITLFGIPFSFRVKGEGPNKFIPNLKFQIIPVDKNHKKAFCFTINNSYVKYFAVVLKSLIDNSSKDKIYDIVVFADDITPQNKERLEAMLPSNFSLRFFDMKSYVKGQFCKLKLQTNEHWPLLVFYRCFIPFVMKYYDKVLYLDSDVLINKNVDDIFNINLDDKQIGACIDIMGVMEEDLKDVHIKYRKNVLKIKNLNDYFNSGVILFDITKIDLSEYFERFVNFTDRKKYMCPDQDALNLIFSGKTKALPLEYNCQYACCLYDKELEQKILPSYRQKIIDAINDPCIIHFLIKPWTTSKQQWGKLHDKFWECAKKTSFYEEIFISSIPKIYINEFKNKDKKLSLLEKMFSVRNEYINGDKYKVITFLGKNRKKYSPQKTLSPF